MCPGRCGRTEIPVSKLACAGCWYRLPTRLRNRINEAYRDRKAHPEAHRDVVAEAIDWYRANPKQAAS